MGSRGRKMCPRRRRAARYGPRHTADWKRVLPGGGLEPPPRKPGDPARIACNSTSTVLHRVYREIHLERCGRDDGTGSEWTWCRFFFCHDRQTYATTLLSSVKRRDAPANTFVPERGRRTRRNTSDGGPHGS